MIQIFGTRGMSQEKLLGNNIDGGSTRNFEIEDFDVGEINKVIIKTLGNKGYRCKLIKILKNKHSTDFQCLRALLPCIPGGSPFNCQDELLPQGDSSYEITLKTHSDIGSGTTAPILVGVIGEKGISNYQMLSESGAADNSQVKEIIKIKDVGNVTGYQIRLPEKGKWKGLHMIIKPIKTGMVSQFDLKDVFIKNPGKDFFKYDISEQNGLLKMASSSSSSNSNSQFSTSSISFGGFSRMFEYATQFAFSVIKTQASDDDKGLTEITFDSSDGTHFVREGSLDKGDSSSLNPHNTDGGLIEIQEKKGNFYLVQLNI